MAQFIGNVEGNANMYTDPKYDVFDFVNDFCKSTKKKDRLKSNVMDVEELFRAAYISNRDKFKDAFAKRWTNMTFWDHLQYVLFLAQDCAILPESENVQADTIELLRKAKAIIDKNLEESEDGYIEIAKLQDMRKHKAHYRLLNPHTDLIYENLNETDRQEMMKKLNPSYDFFNQKNMEDSAAKKYWDEIVEKKTLIQIKIEKTHHYLTLSEFKSQLNSGEIIYPYYDQEEAREVLKDCRYDSLFLYDYIYDSNAPLPSTCNYFPHQVFVQLSLDSRSNGVYQDLTNGSYYLRSDSNLFRIKQGVPDAGELYVCNVNLSDTSSPKTEIQRRLETLEYKPLKFGFASDYDRVVSMLNYTLSSYENLGIPDYDRYTAAISRRMSSNIDSEDNSYYRFGRMGSRRFDSRGRLSGLRSMSEHSDDLWKGGNLLFEYLRSQKPPSATDLDREDLPNEWSNLMKATQKSKTTGKPIPNPGKKKRSLRDNLEATYNKLQSTLSKLLSKVNNRKEKIWYIVPYRKKKMTCTQYLYSVGYTDDELKTLRTTPSDDADLQDDNDIKDRFIRLPKPHLIDPELFRNMKCDEDGTVKLNDPAKSRAIDQFVNANAKHLIPLLVGKFSRPPNHNDTFYSDSIKLKAGISPSSVNADMDLRVPFQLFDGLLLNARSELAQQQDILFKYALCMKGSKLLVHDGTGEYPYSTCTMIQDVQVNTGFVGYRDLLAEGTKKKERSIVFMCDNDASYNLGDLLRGRVRGVSWSANIESEVDKDKWFIFEQHVNLLHYWNMLYCLLLYLLNKARAKVKAKDAANVDVALADSILLMLLELSNVGTTDLIEGINLTVKEFNELSYENRFKLFMEKYQTIIEYIKRVIKSDTERQRVMNAVTRTFQSAAIELNVDFNERVLQTLQPLRIIIGRDNPPDLRSPGTPVTISTGGRRKPRKKVRR